VAEIQTFVKKLESYDRRRLFYSGLMKSSELADRREKLRNVSPTMKTREKLI